ncbi:MAG: T9SS type A sorting domain-containing protein [Bacteroidota bacterium]
MQSRKHIAPFLIILTATLGLAFGAMAETTLSLKKTGASSVEVYLINDEPVAALQFSLSGEGLTLETISAGVRVSNQNWQFSFYKVNEQTINVILIRTGLTALEAGQGAVATVQILANGSGRILLNKVVIASPDAKSIAATLTNLEWSELPEETATLGQNYPNPFNPATTIPYTIEREGAVTLVVYDIAGREIKRVAEGQKPTGSYTAVWNGVDEHGFQVPSGIYLVRLQAGTDVQTKKMTLTR